MDRLLTTLLQVGLFISLVVVWKLSKSYDNSKKGE